jgi:hypothetical protein
MFEHHLGACRIRALGKGFVNAGLQPIVQGVTNLPVLSSYVERVPYQQWTLSFPHMVRCVLLKEAGLLSQVLTLLLRTVFASQWQRARLQGPRGGQIGAVSFHPVHLLGPADDNSFLPAYS